MWNVAVRTLDTSPQSAQEIGLEIKVLITGAGNELSVRALDMHKTVHNLFLHYFFL